MNILGAIIAGIVGTIIMTMVMVMTPKMGMPKMDIVGMLGSMMGMMHAGVKADTVNAPDPYMTNNGGVMSFMGGLSAIRKIIRVKLYYFSDCA
ncbi:hypothetical protein MNBD_CHLOROFLEXI01-3911 [hydrothermal vent metagenome]|uniref:Uncharacterized protein n=1 Tax=hydrothermal vent metagenome TaxID=652676 RepID=A0A3B0UP58_9ZZZZ